MGNEIKMTFVVNNPSMEERIQHTLSKLMGDAKVKDKIAIPVGIQATAYENSVSLENTQNKDRRTDFSMMASIDRNGVASISILNCSKGSRTHCKSVSLILQDRSAIDNLRQIIMDAAKSRSNKEI